MASLAVTPARADRVVELLTMLVDEVRGLRADMAAARDCGRLTVADRQFLARLLPAIGGELGSAAFAVRDLIDEPALQPLIGSRSAKALGKLFARADGATIDGYTVRRAGADVSTALWAVFHMPR